jgi:hypothetical protein
MARSWARWEGVREALMEVSWPVDVRACTMRLESEMVVVVLLLLDSGLVMVS